MKLKNCTYILFAAITCAATAVSANSAVSKDKVKPVLPDIVWPPPGPPIPRPDWQTRALADVAARRGPQLPRPGQPGYSVANAFAAIVWWGYEVNIHNLSTSFGLPDLYDAFKWHGPSGKESDARFGAYYNPPKSTLGITKIVIDWSPGYGVLTGGKAAYLLGLRVLLTPDACPSEKQMTAATGVAMTTSIQSGTDGGPSYLSRSFTVQDVNGRTKFIQYHPAPNCELGSIEIRPT